MTFDLFHTGHVELLQYCRKFAGENGEVVIALNTDRFIEEYKGKRPIVPYLERRDVLLACKYVDQIIDNSSGKDSKPTILKINPDIIVIGMDWLDKDYCAQMQFSPVWLSEHKISLAFVPRTRGVSTSHIKDRL